MTALHTRVLMVSSLAFVFACSAMSSTEDGANGSPVTSTASSPLAHAFEMSAAHSGAPRDLLVAIAKVEDGLTLPAERPDLDVDNDVPAAGPLQLRHGKLNTLARAAEISGKTELDLRIHADLALDAGAMVLAEVGARTGADPDRITSWADAIAEMSGFADEPHRQKYVHQVFAVLARGGKFEGRDGEIITLPSRNDIPPTLTLEVDTSLHTLATAQYPGAEFFPTSCNNKCDAGRGGASVQFIVVHDTEGGWNASVATLQNDPGKSVQYIVGEDGRVGQFVTEETTAYHAGNYHFNQRSVGIEHVGYATKPFPEAEYAASAKLVGHLLTKYKLPKDRAHVIGHDQIPNGSRIAQSSAPCGTSPKACQSNLNYGGASHHTDPGIWEWPTFMVRFGGSAKCNDVTSIWNCSNDKKKAFRCVGDKVEVETCDGVGGCEVKPNGVDDLCHIGPRNQAGTTGTGEEGEPAAPTTPGELGGVGGAQEKSGDGAVGFLPPSQSKPPSSAASCTVSDLSPLRETNWTAPSLLLFVGLLAARKRRSSEM